MSKRPLLCMVLALLSMAAILIRVVVPQDLQPNLGAGDVETLQTAIVRWQQQHEAEGGAENLRIALHDSKALSKQPHQGAGGLRLNLLNGQLQATARGVVPHAAYELWLVNQHAAASNSPPIDGNRFWSVGTATADDNGIVHWQAALRRDALSGFVLDLVAVTPAGQTPAEQTRLAGSPSFLQRWYYSDKPWSVAQLNQPAAAPPQPAFAFLLPKVAMAATHNLSQSLAEKIAKGRDVFINETFNGNGRTCATCHRPDNNHTIDPAYIAQLPKNDPLFVAETNPDLKNLENPQLLRQFGLILANIDGFDKPPVFRSVPHILGLSLSILPEIVDHSGSPLNTSGSGAVYDVTDTNHMIGWSGDGAPGDGSLRQFAVGAITQHSPKTLNRVEGVDFRLPTAEELDALEAYILSLGRSEELNLAKMRFQSPLVDKGRELFDSKLDEGTGKCKGCHNNAGANSSSTTFNGNRDTGVENFELHPARLVAPEIAYDGGFGKGERHNCGANKKQTCYGDGRFNMTSLIEAADTPPYFHNNSVTTLEEAIASYNSVAFNTSPGADSDGKPRIINIDSSKVVAIAAVLRTLNALENIRSSSKKDQRAFDESGKNAKETIRLAMADTEDAIEVLRQSGYNLYPEALTLLQEALELEQKALKGAKKALLLAMDKKNAAKQLMVSFEP